MTAVCVCVVMAMPVDACIARLRLDGAGPAGPGEVGCGPLRLWPGGLAMSRAIQEVDCAPLVLPHPFIQQVMGVVVASTELCSAARVLVVLSLWLLCIKVAV